MHNSYLYSSWTWKCQLIITIILFKNVLSFCPSKCKCTGELNSRTSCINADLEVVPIQLNPDTKYINLTLNKIRNVDFTLPFYTKLEVLDLSQNLIETLGSKNFEFQKELRTLNLSHNDVIQLSKDAFKGLGNLLLLDLSYNRIDIIHTTSMLDLTSLIELDLSNNYIVSIDDGIFKNMISLEILLLKNNQLLDVPANNLEYLKSLKSLDLSDNLIENIKNESFNDLKELIMLSLSGNVISDLNLGAFDGLVGLKSMDIADNNLTVVPTQQLSKLSNLTYLSLSGNRFTHIPAVSLLNLFHLRELHLERLDHLIKIDSRAFIDNTHLQKIYLNNNQNFSDLPMRLFHGNPNLIEISIQGNNLKTIDAAQFPIDRINRLYLGDNPLECNCSLLWLWRLVTSGNTDDTHQKPSTSSAHYQRHYHQHPDDPEYNDIDHNKNLDIKNTLQQKSETLILDSERIGCDIITSSNDHIKIRKLLRNMDENEITCPAHIVTIVCAILSSFVVIMTGASILFYLRIIKKRRKLLNDRRNGKTTILNVHDRIIQQQLNTNTFNHHHNNHNNYHLNHHLHNSTNFNNHLNLQNHHLTTGNVTGTGTGTTNSNQSSIVDDKLELERYLTAQAIANEYRALKPWEITTIKDTKDTTNDYDLQTPSDENHYEKFDHYDYPDTRQLSKPHVVYV